jgi:hypothetical protein
MLADAIPHCRPQRSLHQQHRGSPPEQEEAAERKDAEGKVGMYHGESSSK